MGRNTLSGQGALAALGHQLSLWLACAQALDDTVVPSAGPNPDTGTLGPWDLGRDLGNTPLKQRCPVGLTGPLDSSLNRGKEVILR